MIRLIKEGIPTTMTVHLYSYSVVIVFMQIHPTIDIPNEGHSLDFIEQYVAAGFPNPCEDFLAKPISLDDLLIKRKSSTFLVRVSGDSMLPTISTGSLLVVDKSIKAAHNSIVVAVVDGEFIVKELYLEKDSLPVLHSHNSLYEDIVIDETNKERTDIWGVVTSFIKQL